MDVHVGEAGWRNESFGESNTGKMFVFFHTVQVKNNFKSQKEKRPVYEPRVFITKLVPGDNSLKIDRPMRSQDAEDYPVEWARFEQKKEATASGTPLAAWPELSDTQQAEFRALNIFTIEQFANLPDSAASKVMGFHDLRTKARGFLLAHTDAVKVQQMMAEKEANDARLAAQDAEMADLRAKIAQLMAQPKRGRKPKVRDELHAA